MKTVITLEDHKYLLPTKLTALEAGSLLNALVSLVDFDEEHTPDYEENRFVVKKENVTASISFISDDKVCTPEEFEQLRLLHPEKNENPEQTA